MDKFVHGCLGNKAWPHSAITIGEVGAEYSYLGGKPFRGAASTKGLSCMDGWTGKSLRSCMQVQVV